MRPRPLAALALAAAVLTLAPAAATAQAQAQAQSNTPAFRWVDEPDLYPMVELRAARRHTAFALREVSVGKDQSEAELRRELTKGGVTQVVWRMTIKDKEWTDLVGAAMVVSSDTVYVARYHRIATGTRLYAFAVADGALKWSVSLYGVGPIAHSKWFNQVQLDIDGGNPVAFGNEGPSMGYVEVRDAKTGAKIANTQHKLAGRPKVLAEPLYRELANMLGQKKRYRVRAADFARRHNFTYPSAAERDRLFTEAAGKLDGLPAGKGHMRVTTTAGRGGVVIEAVRTK